jgi:hypothetical protein
MDLLGSALRAGATLSTVLDKTVLSSDRTTSLDTTATDDSKCLLSAIFFSSLLEWRGLKSRGEKAANVPHVHKEKTTHGTRKKNSPPLSSSLLLSSRRAISEPHRVDLVAPRSATPAVSFGLAPTRLPGRARAAQDWETFAET